MSTETWESGTIKLPSKEYVRFRKSVLGLYNRTRLDTFNKIKRVFADLTIAAKTAEPREMFHLCHDLNVKHRVNVGESGMISNFNSMKIDRVMKKDFDFANSKTRKFEIDRDHIGYVEFNDKDKSVSWVVHEGNNTVTQAHDSAFGVGFIKALYAINWTRGKAGGIIAANDDHGYPCRDLSVGGGANYASHEFGYKAQRSNNYGGHTYGKPPRSLSYSY